MMADGNGRLPPLQATEAHIPRRPISVAWAASIYKYYYYYEDSIGAT